jgi:sucrose-6-phosphate hydrolase SacC (GH32 family)
MSIPTEMTITRETSGYYLHALPVKELETLRKDTVTKQDFTLTEPMKLDIECAPLDITLPSDRECPDLFPLTTSEGEKLWVIIAASDFYIVGKFVGGKFIEINKEKRLNHNRVNYAAQTYSGIDDGRVIRTYWQRAAVPSPTVTQQMSIPTEMSLTRELNGYFLKAIPVKELDTLRASTVTKNDFTLSETVKLDMECAPLDITLEAEYNANETVTLNVFGANVRLDMKNNDAVMLRDKCPISLKKDDLKLRVIVDRCTVEIYADDGRYLLITQQLWDRNLPFVTLSSTAPVKVKEFTVHTLKSIH